MEKKIGVYLCTGCGLADGIDMEKLAGVAGEYKVPVCKQHKALCSKEGVGLIRSDMENEGVNTVVLCACSPRTLTDVFSFPEDSILERVNLREQVLWSMKESDEEDVQMAAEDYLRMGIVRVQKTGIPEPYMEEIDKSVLVVGGGVAGMTSALETARAGYSVTLVEKQAQLGGWSAKQAKSYPTAPPYNELQDMKIDSLIEEVQGNGGIKVLLGAKIQEIKGAPGMFDVKIEANGTEQTLRAGSIVQATGWKPYDATKLGKLGYGLSPNVVTGIEIEQMMKDKGSIAKPSDGQAPAGVVFVQCAGSRDPEHLPYCSSVCCMTSMKQAVYLKEQNPETEVYILYKDIRTPGQYEDFYRKVQKDGVVFAKGDVTSVSEQDGRIVVEADDALLGEPLMIETDMVVLATGMVPSEATADDMKPVAEGAKPEEAEGEEEASEIEAGDGKTLHLTYRQGPELPKLKYGMPDSHFICFPYETRRTGIYAAGCLRQPMDVLGVKEDAAGAALKAIQAVEMTSRGEALHPRAGDKSYPELFMQRCTQCKRCTEECPFGMYNEDEKSNPLPNPTRCRRCAICMGSCPERIISFKDYSVDMIGSMIKSLEVPEEDEEKPRVLVLACENDAYPALDMLGRRGFKLSPYIRVVPLRCVGSMNLVWIADALSKGIDGVLILGCRHGDDYQCHFVKGSELASYRLSKISETLDRLVLESERVRMEQIEITDYDRLSGIIESFMETIEEVGPNPYKGF